MPTGAVLVIIILGFVAFFIFYKRHMLVQMFSLDIASMADEFQSQIGMTADQAIKRLEEQMSQLEYLLQEADAKIAVMNEQQQKIVKLLDSLPDSLETVQYRSCQPACIPDGSQQSQAAEPSKLLSYDRKKMVLTMADQGYSVVEIAKAAAMGKGEVMLLLELNKN